MKNETMRVVHEWESFYPDWDGTRFFFFFSLWWWDGTGVNIHSHATLLVPGDPYQKLEPPTRCGDSRSTPSLSWIPELLTLSLRETLRRNLWQIRRLIYHFYFFPQRCEQRGAPLHQQTNLPRIRCEGHRHHALWQDDFSGDRGDQRGHDEGDRHPEESLRTGEHQ